MAPRVSPDPSTPNGSPQLATANGGRSVWRDATLAVAIFAPTLFFVPHSFFIVTTVVAIFVANARLKFRSSDILILLFVVLGYINLFVGTFAHGVAPNFSSYGLVFSLATVYIARTTNRRTLRFLILLTLLECPAMRQPHLQE